MVKYLKQFENLLQFFGPHMQKVIQEDLERMYEDMKPIDWTQVPRKLRQYVGDFFPDHEKSADHGPRTGPIHLEVTTSQSKPSTTKKKMKLSPSDLTHTYATNEEEELYTSRRVYRAPRAAHIHAAALSEGSLHQESTQPHDAPVNLDGVSLSMAEEPSSQAENLSTIKGFLSIQPTMGTVDFERLYGQEGRKDTSPDYLSLLPLEDIEEQTPSELGVEWTYQRLARTTVIQQHCASLATMIRKQMASSPPTPRQVCLLIDNSGSMGFFNKPVHVAEAIVIFCETMKLVELPFAVAKFGAKEATKLILKRFRQSFSFIHGQQILESLSYDEATAPATALRRIPPEVWDEEEEEVQRVMVMITDGMTNENATSKYTGPMEMYKFSLSILHLSEGCSKQSPLSMVFDQPGIVAHRVEKNEHLPLVLSQTMANIFTSTHHLPAAVLSSEKRERVSLAPLATKTGEPCSLLEGPALDVQTHDNQTSLYRTSDPNATLPACQEDPQREEWTSLSDHLEELRLAYQPGGPPAYPELSKWHAFTQEHHALIQSFVQMFEDVFFEPNQFTRYKASGKGSSLHLPGLIKAVSSNYNYKKYFRVKQAGERRNYGIALVLDISLSMRGELSHYACHSLLLCLAALQQMGLENTYVILYSKSPKVIKVPEYDVNAQFLSLLAHQIPLVSSKDTPEEYESNDHLALLCARELFQSEGSSRQAKKIFVFSDGYSTAPQRTCQVVSQLEQENIPVWGVGTGYTNFGFDSYHRWVTAVDASHLPKAFRSYHASSFIPKEPTNWHQLKSAEADASLKQIFDEGNMQTAFPELAQLLQTERELHIERDSSVGALSVDLCFVVDLTGSMKPYLKVIQTQILSIAKGIQDFLDDKFGDAAIRIRYGLIGYRDYEEYSNDWLRCDFLEELDELETVVTGSTFVGQGGGDLPEDVLGGLDDACQLSWQSRARYIVWVGDAPAHGMQGQDMVDRPTTPHPRQLTADSVLSKMVNDDIDFVAVQVVQQHTQVMINQMQKIWKTHHEEEFISVVLQKRASSNRSHFVFVLDESGSMGRGPGSRWDDVLKCQERFRRGRCGDQTNDIISLITFADDAVVHFEGRAAEQATFMANPRRRGTSFIPALQAAFPVLQAQPDCSPVLVFMSDGECGGVPRICDTLVQGARRLNGLRFYAVAFHAGGADSLASMVQAVKQAGLSGELLRSNSRMDLQQNFDHIANSSQVTDALQDVVGSKIADAVGYRIYAEHL